jgi:hypothetical protein
MLMFGFLSINMPTVLTLLTRFRILFLRKTLTPENFLQYMLVDCGLHFTQIHAKTRGASRAVVLLIHIQHRGILQHTVSHVNTAR